MYHFFKGKGSMKVSVKTKAGIHVAKPTKATLVTPDLLSSEDGGAHSLSIFNNELILAKDPVKIEPPGLMRSLV